MCELNRAIDTFLPLQTITKHPTDRPWMTKKIKNCIYKRQTAFYRYGKESLTFKYWRNKTQYEIKMAKYHYYNNRVSNMTYTSSNKWWREIKRLSGQDIKQEWHHQFLDDHTIIKSLANNINAAQNATNRSKTIQNEIIKTSGGYILSKISDEIKESKLF